MAPKRRMPGAMPIVEKLYRKNQENYDNAGGFDVADDEIEERRARIAELAQQKRDREAQSSQKPDFCLDCDRPLLDAYLWNTFNHPVCDTCSRQNPEKYKTISRTRAKSEYLLKDEDLDYRRPILRYISKKNPHNPRYGDMKLYLELKIIERAVEIHGSIQELENTRELRQEKKEVMTAKRYENKIKRMQKELRSNIQIRTDFHEHDYGPESYNAEKKVYCQTCKTCNFLNEYEKL